MLVTGVDDSCIYVCDCTNGDVGCRSSPRANLSDRVATSKRPLLGYPMGTILCTLMGFVIALESSFAYSALGLNYPIDFGLIPSRFMIAPP